MQEAGYNFGEWMVSTKNFKGVASRLEVPQDKDAMLEIHYASNQDKIESTTKDEKSDLKFPVPQKEPINKLAPR